MDMQLVCDAIQQRHRLVSMHAATELLADALDPDDVWASLLQTTAKVIEDYPTDPRGPCCLILSFVAHRPIHSVIAYPARRTAVKQGVNAVAFLVTVYRPDQRSWEWSPDYRTRLVQP